MQDDTKPFWNSLYPYSCGQHFDSLKSKFLFLNQRRNLVLVVLFFSAKIDSEEEDEDDLFSGKKEKSESDNDEEEESEEEPQQPKKVIVVKCKYSTYRTQTFKFILYLCTILYLFSYGFHSIY